MKSLSMKTAALPLVLTALVAGCTTMGTGFGSTASGQSPVNFSWQSSDNVSGTMNATLSDGKTFTGQYFQITTDTTIDNLGPLWAGWGPRWRRGGWGYWDAGPEFVKHYTGKVVANLSTPDGTHMRCTFRLVHPSSGMAGGGRGNCQSPDGSEIEATFPKA
jgi:hypothetical protein